MICKKCGKKYADVYYKQTINGKTTEYALCSECADELKKNGELDIKMPFAYDGFGDIFGLDNFFGISNLPNSAHKVHRSGVSEKKRCTFCASTFDDLVRTGKVGCHKCYEVFADELKPSIENIHGNAKYMGRRPGKRKTEEIRRDKNDSIQDKIKALRTELDEAVSNQEYEKAAVIRDKIREIENNA